MQKLPQALLLQRGDLVQLLLRSAPCLGLAAEVAHDAVQLLDRVLPTGLAATVSGRLLAAACLHVMCQRNIQGVSMLAQLFQVPPQQVLVTAKQVQQMMGDSCMAVSPMRVLHLFLERLGWDSEDTVSIRHMGGKALATVGRVAMSPAFIGCPPSIVAMVVLYACRVAAGLLPSWPVALLTLTDHIEANEVLQPYVKAAMQLVLEM